MISDLSLNRYEEDNFFNYTPTQKSIRRKAIRDMCKDYPTLPEAWMEMLYDWSQYTDIDEQHKIINEKLWEKPGKFSFTSTS